MQKFVNRLQTRRSSPTLRRRTRRVAERRRPRKYSQQRYTSGREASGAGLTIRRPLSRRPLARAVCRPVGHVTLRCIANVATGLLLLAVSVTADAQAAHQESGVSTRAG